MFINVSLMFILSFLTFSPSAEKSWEFLSHKKMLFRVVISAQDIRKLYLDSVQDSVDGLELVLKDKLQLRSSFDLQYEDEDFKDFCNLTCLDDLPKEKVTLQVVFHPVSSDWSLDSFSSAVPSSLAFILFIISI